jgi:hypothetical protein
MTKWECIEIGWYTSKLGGICKEQTGKWHCYPMDTKVGIPSSISFKSLASAKAWFEKKGK